MSLTACSGGRNSLWNDGPNYGPRVIPLGQPVPKGGGEYKLGKAYHDREGHVYVPREDPHYDRSGIASWYGEDFHGRRTANGEIYDMEAITAAHTTLPLPCYARVTNLSNGRSMVVRVNDRGPYVDNRIIDLSWAVASLLQIESAGTGRVRVQYVGPAPLDGNDRHERQILAQQPWAGPRVAYAASPAKALRGGGGGWQQYSSNAPFSGDGQNSSQTQSASGGDTMVREKFIRDRLTPVADANPDQQWLKKPDGAAPQRTATLALMSADVEAGAAPRRAPPPVKPAAQVQPKPTALPKPRPVAQASLAYAASAAGHAKAQPQTQGASASPTLTASASPKAVAKKPVFDSAAAGPTASAPPAQPVKPSSIYIEAGVFRERALADKLTAILAEIAPASVELASSGTEIVHRVKVGPFEKPDAAEAAAARIKAAGLNGARILPARGI